jgi:VanZ family protein
MKRPTRIRIDVRYAVLTVAAFGVIYWLSSMPDHDGTQQDPLVLLISNLSHAPVFAALAFALLRTVAKGPQVSVEAIGLAFLGAGAGAALDEWHQSFVPGRDASVTDLLLDLAGIGGMLMFLHRRGLRGNRQQTPVPTNP